MFDSLPTGLMGNIGTGYDYHAGRTWAADNGCFNANWQADKWLAWLERWSTDQSDCLFAVVPDVVGDHDATVELWPQWMPIVTSMGYSPAFVAQNGCNVGGVPWAEVGAVFIGGDDAYKLSSTAAAIVAEANRRGVWAHMGRVNSLRRMRIADDMGCDSVDGTFIAFGPDVNTARLASWFQAINHQPSLWGNA